MPRSTVMRTKRFSTGHNYET